MEFSSRDPKLKMIVSLQLNVLDVWMKKKWSRTFSCFVIYDKQQFFSISKAETRQTQRCFSSLAVVFVTDKNVLALYIMTNRVFFKNHYLAF